MTKPVLAALVLAASTTYAQDILPPQPVLHVRVTAAEARRLPVGSTATLTVKVEFRLEAGGAWLITGYPGQATRLGLHVEPVVLGEGDILRIEISASRTKQVKVGDVVAQATQIVPRKSYPPPCLPRGQTCPEE